VSSIGSRRGRRTVTGRLLGGSLSGMRSTSSGVRWGLIPTIRDRRSPHRFAPVPLPRPVPAVCHDAVVPTRPVVLLPPSEGKSPGGPGRPLRLDRLSFPELNATREQMIDAVVRAMRSSTAARQKLLGVTGTTLAEATAADLALRSGPTMPAIDRFTGVLYDELDAGSLSKRDRSRLDEQVVIFSGIFGLLSPTDPIPDHRLKMNVTLPGIGKVSTAWRDPISQALAGRVAGATVWNLLPGEHAAAWRPAAVGASGGPAAMYSVRFLDEGPRQRGTRSFTTVSHWNKLLKGALVRFVLSTGADGPDALARFDHPEGYALDPTLTEESKGVTVLAMVRPRR